MDSFRWLLDPRMWHWSYLYSDFLKQVFRLSEAGVARFLPIALVKPLKLNGLSLSIMVTNPPEKTWCTLQRLLGCFTISHSTFLAWNPSFLPVLIWIGWLFTVDVKTTLHVFLCRSHIYRLFQAPNKATDDSQLSGFTSPKKNISQLRANPDVKNDLLSEHLWRIYWLGYT